jgi:CRP/FNR family transcriptional regulator, cyclic AMP receptor protein
VREYASGSAIIREAETTTFVVVLLTGWTKVTALTEAGGVALLSVRHGGDVVGEFAGLDAQPRSATVTAAGAVLAKVIRAEDFVAFLSRDQAAAAAISRSIIAKARWNIARRIDFAGCSVATRLARVLVELDRSYGQPGPEGGRTLGVQLTQPELAALVGAQDPTVHKALRELRQAGIIETRYRSIVIIDMARLRSAAGLEPDRPAG